MNVIENASQSKQPTDYRHDMIPKIQTCVNKALPLLEPTRIFHQCGGLWIKPWHSPQRCELTGSDPGPR